MGHLYVEGAAIDALGSIPSSAVSAAYRASRAARDGLHFHMTLMHSAQVDSLRHEWSQELLQERALAVEEAQRVFPTPVLGGGPQGSLTPVAAASSASDGAAPSAAPSDSSPPPPRVRGQLTEELLLRYFSSRLDTGPVDLGLGCARQGAEETFFRVLHWPQISELRRQLGAPSADMHVTVGYKGTDVHGVKKDKSTLLSQQ
jgi:hypothetical protein